MGKGDVVFEQYCSYKHAIHKHIINVIKLKQNNWSVKSQCFVTGLKLHIESELK